MKKFEEQFNESVENAIDKYSNSDASIPLRAAIVAIPIIGSSIDTMITATGQQIAQKRWQTLFNSISEEIKNIDKSKIDFEYLKSEEFYDLIRESIELAFKTSDDEKLRYFSKIFVNAIVEKEVSYHIEYMRSIAELSHEEMLIIIEMYNDQKNINLQLHDTTIAEDREEGSELLEVGDKGWDELYDKMNEKYDLDKSSLPFLLKRAEKTGLIKEITGNYWGYGGGAYIITPTLKKLMKILEKD